MAIPTEAGAEVHRRQLRALLDLARSSFEATKGTSPDLSHILEASATVLEAERASFWRYDDERRTLHCEHLYERSADRHLTQDALPSMLNPHGFEVLPEVRVTVLRNSDKDTGITSLLEAPVRMAGVEIGVVRHERVGQKPPDFSPEDALFAGSIADLVALALEFWQPTRSEERLAHVSLHDPLTDLPNRRLFLERVDRALRGLERRSGLVAVLSLDLDHFGRVNETAGRLGGDAVLVAIARAITSVLRPADLPARLGGDSFGVLIDRLDEPWEAIAVAERVQQALGRSHPREQTPALPSASIGVALTDGSRAISATDLLREADIALARAREKGPGRYEVFESAMRRDMVERMSLGWALRDALQAGQLALEFQAEVSLITHGLLGVEALLRWDRPGHGRLGAEVFGPLAESSGLIVPIGTWVLGEACRRARGWREDPRAANLLIRVNLSARQFERPDLVDTVSAALHDSGLPAEALCLEITETVLMSDAPAALRTLTALKALGVDLAIDDFGIGYSSLAYLKRFPVDTLKIDRSFVEGLGTDPLDLPIVQAVLSLGHTLGLDVVAEGVETPLQEKTLKALGCQRAQGFLYARPRRPEDVPSLFSPA